MLQFHGIRVKNGVPERFETRFDLFASLQEVLEVLSVNPLQISLAIQKIHQK